MRIRSQICEPRSFSFLRGGSDDSFSTSNERVSGSTCAQRFQVFQVMSARSVYFRFMVFSLLSMSLCAESFAASSGIVGDWETSGRHDGLLITLHGVMDFYNYQHRCPTSWSKYVLRGNNIQAIDVETHRPRSLQVISASEIRDTSTGYVYHPVSSITFSGNPKRC
jgi:hypothetical protein